MSGHVDYSCVTEILELETQDEVNDHLRNGWTLLDVKVLESDSLYSRDMKLRRSSVVYVMARLARRGGGDLATDVDAGRT